MLHGTLDGDMTLEISGRSAADIAASVRALIERGVIEMMANLYGMPGPEGCLTTDPLADPTIGVTGGFTPAYNNVATNNAQTREDPNRWHDRRDSAAATVVRGRY
jgi:curli production assembly/transport component CsgG/holdfast attachment protein HfaB